MSVLAQKIKGSSFQPDAYPRLKELTNGFCEIVAAALEASYGQEELDLKAEAERVEAFDGAGDVVYVFTSAEGGDIAALTFPAPFLKALSEASLGGAFALNENAAKPSALEQSLGEPFAMEALSAACSLLSPADAGVARASFRFTATETDPKALAKLFDGQSYFKTDIRIHTEGSDPVHIISCLFPIEFLERRGLLKQGKEKSTAAVDAEWREKMLKHVHASEIDIDVVMDRYTTLLSELAELEPGQIVPLEGDAHKTLSLHLNTEDGPVLLGKGRLGTYKKKKAVKLTTDLAPPLPAE